MRPTKLSANYGRNFTNPKTARSSCGASLETLRGELEKSTEQVNKLLLVSQSQRQDIGPKGQQTIDRLAIIVAGIKSRGGATYSFHAAPGGGRDGNLMIIDKTFVMTDQQSSRAAERVARQFKDRGGIQHAWLDREQRCSVIVVHGTTPQGLTTAAEDVRTALSAAGARFQARRNWTKRHSENKIEGPAFSNRERREIWTGFVKDRGF
ncbi:MAG: hypothetical protein HYX72_10415 [Acidobacteria bacterium]|nr:hypothetical protein [Acidobacteriota bacterium]